MNDLAQPMLVSPADEPTVLITRKTLMQAADRFMANATGIYTQDDVFNAVSAVVDAANTKTLINELAWAITRDVIKRRTTPHLNSTDDWIGYGELAITLPERKIVNVYYAQIEALDHRIKNVVENRDRVNQAAEADISRINTIKKLMLKMGVETAGPALEVLAAMESP